MPEIRSARGKKVNMEALAKANEKAVAVSPSGAHTMNTRGDILGRGGKIVKTAEEREHAYATNLKNAVQNVPYSKDQTESRTPNPNHRLTAAQTNTSLKEDMDSKQNLTVEELYAPPKPEPVVAEKPMVDEVVEEKPVRRRRRRTTSNKES